MYGGASPSITSKLFLVSPEYEGPYRTDSAEFFSRCFGTKEIQKTTQRIANAKEIDSAEIVGEGTTRDAHQFRASPDLLKTLPTGVGAVLIAHGQETPHGASSVFKIRFPELRKV